jgi:hypothetical protein
MDNSTNYHLVWFELKKLIAELFVIVHMLQSFDIVQKLYVIVHMLQSFDIIQKLFVTVHMVQKFCIIELFMTIHI